MRMFSVRGRTQPLPSTHQLQHPSGLFHPAGVTPLQSEAAQAGVFSSLTDTLKQTLLPAGSALAAHGAPRKSEGRSVWNRFFDRQRSVADSGEDALSVAVETVEAKQLEARLSPFSARQAPKGVHGQNDERGPPAPTAVSLTSSIAARIISFTNPFDVRYEDYFRGGFQSKFLGDVQAGLVVAMVAIPLAMGFAIASGLSPEQGIVGGAVAGIAGALWGGSKYQVYGPTAAFIPVIAGVVAAHGYPLLVSASIASGFVLMGLGLLGVGKYVTKYVPDQVVVGFTIGIAGYIAQTQLGGALGIEADLGKTMLTRLSGLSAHLGEINHYAVALAAGTFVLTRYFWGKLKGFSIGLLKVNLKKFFRWELSYKIPAPLIAVVIATASSYLLPAAAGLIRISDKFPAFAQMGMAEFFKSSLPVLPTWDVAGGFLYAVSAIVFVSAVESLLSSRMADNMAKNKGTPFNANRELFGQGGVQIATALVNGFPHTGALARTAANIVMGAATPMAGVFKGIFKIALAVGATVYLAMIPMPVIAGILFVIAANMIKGEEIRKVGEHGKQAVTVMWFTAAMVMATDFLVGVGSGMALYLGLQAYNRARGDEGAVGEPRSAKPSSEEIIDAAAKAQAIVDLVKAQPVDAAAGGWPAVVRKVRRLLPNSWNPTPVLTSEQVRELSFQLNRISSNKEAITSRDLRPLKNLALEVQRLDFRSSAWPNYYMDWALQAAERLDATVDRLGLEEAARRVSAGHGD